MLIFGLGGHAKVIVDVLLSKQILISGFFDDNLNAKPWHNFKFLGAYNIDILSDESLVIAIGDNKIRKQISELVIHKFGNAIHATAQISQYSKVDKGTVVFHNAIIQANTLVGKHAIINTAAVVEHDCIIGDYVQIASNATICGGVHIAEGAWVGAGATVIPKVKIGKWATVGAGSAVINDVADYEIVAGCPAKPIK
ncbi:MAG: acetyltransferase [Bacteroidota bacterium]|nr:acetyltransferase [Bacteroidota bacterium]